MRLFNASASAAAESDTVTTQHSDRGVFRPVQATISATGTVRIRGRNAPDLAWVTLHEFTESGAETVTLMREMSGEITANTGTITLDLDV